MECAEILGLLVCRGEMSVNTVIAPGGLVVDPATPPTVLPERPRLVLLTHGHADHFRYAASLRSRGAQIAAPRHCLAMIENPSVNHMATTGWAGPVSEEEITRYFLGPGVRVDILVEPGTLPQLGRRGEAYPAPGHTPGHLVYTIETGAGRILVAGDTVYGVDYVDRVPLLYHTDTLQWLASLEKLARLDVDALVPGHGEPVEGRREVLKLLRRNMVKIEEMLELALRHLPHPGEPPVYADEVAARLCEATGYARSRRAYSALGPTTRALLRALRAKGVAELVFERGVPAWRRAV